MNTNKKIILLLMIISFTIIPKMGASQTNAIKIKFIGNCGLYLTDGNLNVYVDFPYKSGAFNYMEYDREELDSIKNNSIFLFTHKHPDHYSIKNMRKTIRKKKGSKYGKWNLKKLEELNNTIPDFHVKAIETEHSLSFKHYSYLITWRKKRIYFYGDTETASTVLEMNDLDWAFVPYWTAVEVQDKEVEIDTEMLGVYHFYPTMQVTNSSPEKIKLLINKGEIISIPY